MYQGLLYFTNTVLMLAGLTLGYYSYQIDNNSVYDTEHNLGNQILYYSRLFYLVLFPYFAGCVFAHWIKSPFYKQEETYFPLYEKIYFRYVTRGNNQTLVVENVRLLSQLIYSVNPHQYVIEVVSDSPFVDFESENCKFIIVPENYKINYNASPTLYKARALHYALSQSEAKPEDWIVHLDEETKLTKSCVLSITKFARFHPDRIGQGSIVYYPKSFQSIFHYINTLADSLRTADDMGKFRVQFSLGNCWCGMKGSFIVLKNKIEQSIGFNYGIEGSITEDAYFALKAKEAGHQFGFITDCMFEKSPFTMVDFLRQRRRWITGLRKVYNSKIPNTLILRLLVYLWMFSSFSFLLVVSYLFTSYTKNLAIEALLGVNLSLYFIVYLNGWLISVYYINREREKVSLTSLVFGSILQLILLPIFSILETVAVLYAFVSPESSFHIVEKN